MLPDMSAGDLEDLARVKTIDAFLFRFIKIQDMMGHKLFREVLDAVGEYDESMSMLDVLDRLEKLGLIKSTEQWLDYRNLRNLVAHEYPDRPDDVLEGVRGAMAAYDEMAGCFDSMKRYLEERGLLA